MAWDASFKNILKYFFSQLSPVSASIEVITETDVPTANLRIDFLIKHQQSLTYPFNYCRNEIIGEFKSDRDVFNLDELHRSIAKSYLHATSTDLDEITLCYIIGGMRNLPSSIIEMYNTDKISDGIHQLDHSLDIIVILLDNLRYTPAIQFLGLLQVHLSDSKQSVSVFLRTIALLHPLPIFYMNRRYRLWHNQRMSNLIPNQSVSNQLLRQLV